MESQPVPQTPIQPAQTPPTSFISKNRLLLIIVLTLAIGIFISTAVMAYFLSQQKQQEAQKQSAITPVPTTYSVSLVPSESVDPTANWKTYTTTNTLFQFRVNKDIEVSEEKQARTDLFDNYTYLKKNNQIITTIVFVSKEESSKSASLDNYVERERLVRPDLPNQEKQTLFISGFQGYRFKLNPYGNPGPVAVVKINNQYISFTNHENPDFDQILSTFKFTPISPTGGNQTSYSCPSRKYIDCMPIVAPTRAAECKSEYISWVQTNCPGVEITY